MTAARGILVGFVLLVGAAAFHVTSAGDAVSEMKHAAKSVAHDTKQIGKEIAHESKTVGHAVADASKKVGHETAKDAKTTWEKTCEWTTEKSQQIADATVRWWDDVIRSKEDKRER